MEDDLTLPGPPTPPAWLRDWLSTPGPEPCPGGQAFFRYPGITYFSTKKTYREP